MVSHLIWIFPIFRYVLCVICIMMHRINVIQPGSIGFVQVNALLTVVRSRPLWKFNYSLLFVRKYFEHNHFEVLEVSNSILVVCNCNVRALTIAPVRHIHSTNSTMTFHFSLPFDCSREIQLLAKSAPRKTIFNVNDFVYADIALKMSTFPIILIFHHFHVILWLAILTFVPFFHRFLTLFRPFCTVFTHSGAVAVWRTISWNNWIFLGKQLEFCFLCSTKTNCAIAIVNK